MKIIHTFILLPVLLGGCSLPNRRPADSDARQFVDAQISTNLQLIELAQKNLQQVSATVQPVRSSPAKINKIMPSATMSSPGTLRGLTSIKSLGTPESFTLVSVRSRNLKLEEMLYKVIPAGWSAIISADLKAQFKQQISLEANDQWPYALDRLLRQHGWVALIDWSEKQVSVAYKTPVFKSKPFTVSVESKSSPSTTTAAITPRNPVNASPDKGNKSMPAQISTVTTPATKVPPAAKIWRAEQGSTLKDTLYSWAAGEKCTAGQSGSWNVAWLTEVNYRIDAPLSFSGTFKDALNGVFRLYTTATVPLYAGVNTSQCLLKVDAKEVR